MIWEDLKLQMVDYGVGLGGGVRGLIYGLCVANLFWYVEKGNVSILRE